MFNRMLHPDFVYAVLTEKQIYEIGWYFERMPFGHDVDHLMQARIAAAFSGEPESKCMPKVKLELEYEEMKSQFPGLKEYMESLSGNH